MLTRSSKKQHLQHSELIVFRRSCFLDNTYVKHCLLHVFRAAFFRLQVLVLSRSDRIGTIVLHSPSDLQSRAKQSKSKAKQSKAKQSKAKQSKARQSKAKQSKAKQSKAKQSRSSKFARGARPDKAKKFMIKIRQSESRTAFPEVPGGPQKITKQPITCNP